MYYGAIKKYDIANGEGVRVSLFVSGCRNHCPHCFQKETWDFCYGTPFTEETIREIIEAMNHPYIEGLSLLGGEPMEEENQRKLLPLVQTVKKIYPDKNIWSYTGYVLDDLLTGGKKRCEVTDELLSCLDVLVDGPFKEEQKDITLTFRGSANQRVIDMKQTLAKGSIVLYME